MLCTQHRKVGTRGHSAHACAVAECERLASLAEIACASIGVGSLAGVATRVQDTLDALGSARDGFSQETLAMVVAGAAALPVSLVAELL